MEDVATYTERLVVMHEGRIVLDGKTREVFSFEKELGMMGLAVPQVTTIMNRLKEKGVAVRGNVLTVEEAKEEILKNILMKNNISH